MQVDSREMTMCDSKEMTVSRFLAAFSFRARRLRLACLVAQMFCALLLMLGSTLVFAGSVRIPGDGYGSLSDFPKFISGSFAANKYPLGIRITYGAAVPGITASGVTCSVQKVVTVTGTPVPGMANVFQTDVPGLGLRFAVPTGWGGVTAYAPFAETLSPTSDQSNDFRMTAELIATGPVGVGTFTTMPSLTISFSGSCITPLTVTWNVTPGTTVTGLTCSVTTPSVDVTLPRVLATNLSTVGAATGAASFKLGVNCPQGINVNVTLTDASNGSNSSTTLGLAPGSSAAGVGLQILNGSTPVAYGPDSPTKGNLSQWLAGKSAGGPMDIPLTVQYVRTAGTLI